MEAVLKVGGSLSESREVLLRLCKKLGELAKRHRIAVVPGGGEFADTVRKFDATYSLSNKTAHKMAVLAMDQYGLMLSDVTHNSRVTDSIREVKKLAASGVLPVFLPSKLLFHEDPLENSWDVTSDTIAAYIAGLLKSEKLVLVTDVDGLFSDDPERNRDARLVEEVSVEELRSWGRRTAVDKALPTFLLNTKMDCYVVNGKHPERIRDILENRRTVCTHLAVQ